MEITILAREKTVIKMPNHVHVQDNKLLIQLIQEDSLLAFQEYIRLRVNLGVVAFAADVSEITNADYLVCCHGSFVIDCFQRR